MKYHIGRYPERTVLGSREIDDIIIKSFKVRKFKAVSIIFYKIMYM